MRDIEPELARVESGDLLLERGNVACRPSGASPRLLAGSGETTDLRLAGRDPAALSRDLAGESGEFFAVVGGGPPRCGQTALLGLEGRTRPEFAPRSPQ